jgi:hypothetical protein
VVGVHTRGTQVPPRAIAGNPTYLVVVKRLFQSRDLIGRVSWPATVRATPPAAWNFS